MYVVWSISNKGGLSDRSRKGVVGMELDFLQHLLAISDLEYEVSLTKAGSGVRGGRIFVNETEPC